MAIDMSVHHAHAIRTRNAQIIQGAVLLWLVICFCLAVMNQDILPAKYFFDSGNIVSRFSYVQHFSLGNSYDNTALFYDLLLLSESQHFTAFITSFVFSVFVFICFTIPRQMDLRGVHNVLLFAFTCLTGAIYLAQYSKEAIAMLVVFLFFCLSRTRLQQLIWIVVVCVYAAYFRTYWFLVLAMYIYYSIVLKISRRTILVLFSVIVAFLMLAIAFKVVLGVDLAYYRYVVNDSRMYDSNANSMITPLLPTGNIVLEWLNAIIQFFLMFFPFPLLTGNPVYLLFFLVTASIGLRLYRIIRSSINEGQLGNSIRENRCMALILAFVTIQSIFEPDYGSYIKHLTPMLPLVLYVLCWQQKWRPKESRTYA